MTATRFGHLRRYLIGHGAPAAVAGVIVIAIVNSRLGSTVFRVGQQQPVSVPLMAVIPVGLTATMVVLATARARTVDFVACRFLAGYRVGLDVGLLALALLALWYSSPSVEGAQLGPGAGLRNLVGLTGLAWMFSSLLGDELAWIPPVVLVLLAVIVGVQPTPITGLWSWLLSASTAGSTLGVAVGLCIIGLLVRAATTHWHLRPLISLDAVF